MVSFCVWPIALSLMSSSLISVSLNIYCIPAVCRFYTWAWVYWGDATGAGKRHQLRHQALKPITGISLSHTSQAHDQHRGKWIKGRWNLIEGVEEERPGPLAGGEGGMGGMGWRSIWLNRMSWELLKSEGRWRVAVSSLYAMCLKS